MSTEFRKLLMAMEKRGAYKKGKKAITGIKDYRAILIQDEVNWVWEEENRIEEGNWEWKITLKTFQKRYIEI